VSGGQGRAPLLAVAVAAANVAGGASAGRAAEPAGRARGQVYRQEYYPAGGALDQARVLGLHTRLSVPYGTFTKALSTMEWSPVEPQYEKKVYAAGVGEIAEQVVQGGHERFVLVSVTHA
jgi:hypothetical protein